MGTAGVQGGLWGARPDDWAEVNEPAWRQVFEAALSCAGVDSGTQHLDIGCGAGGALVASHALGAKVTGLDASENLVAIARRRLPGARIEVGEMEALPFAEATCDAVTFINSLQFAGDPVRALAEARQVTRRGGTVLVVVWGRREDCALVSLTMPAVFALLPPSPPGGAAPRAWAEPGVIEDAMRRAGLTPTEEGEFDGALSFPDADTAIRAVLSASARAIAHAGVEAVTAAVRGTLPAVTKADGSVTWSNRFRWVKATRD